MKGVCGFVMVEVVGVLFDGLKFLLFGSWDGVVVGDEVEIV